MTISFDPDDKLNAEPRSQYLVNVSEDAGREVWVNGYSCDCSLAPQTHKRKMVQKYMKHCRSRKGNINILDTSVENNRLQPFTGFLCFLLRSGWRPCVVMTILRFEGLGHVIICTNENVKVSVYI